MKIPQTHSCADCKHCIYSCNGGYICDLTDEIVIIDFLPTEHYCDGKDFEDEYSG